MKYRVEMWIEEVEDNYAEGEKDYREDLSETITLHASNPMKALNIGVEAYTAINFIAEDWIINACNDLLSTVKFVDRDWMEIKGARWDEWVAGKVKGYNLYIMAEVSECKPIVPLQNEFFRDLELV